MMKPSPYHRGWQLTEKLLVLSDAELGDFTKGFTSHLTNDVLVNLFNAALEEVADRVASEGWVSHINIGCGHCEWVRNSEEVAALLTKNYEEVAALLAKQRVAR